MPRRATLYTDEGRLPPGMERVGYDSDTGKYTFRASDGSLWETASGMEYGELTRVGGSSPADLEFRARNPQFFQSEPAASTTDVAAGQGQQDIGNIVSPPRPAGGLQRSSSRLGSLRQRVKSVKTSLAGSVNKTLEEVKSAFNKT
ncbi:hypothetical protein EDB82DRAFT_499728 [Fusarium venenatum]|uniref:uncharacterized protein n=1 Tax=Fusarium venenatum TaxID=56646 RepID=UPI001E0C8953|nr:hypothetical protein EDB82DRAFT_499728 [Fusarium venenatum]